MKGKFFQTLRLGFRSLWLYKLRSALAALGIFIGTSTVIGGSLDARQYNLDAYIPLSTFRVRIGDIVMRRRAGGFDGKCVQLSCVQLSQVTLTVRDIEEVDETSDIVTALLQKYHETLDYAVLDSGSRQPG